MRTRNYGRWIAVVLGLLVVALGALAPAPRVEAAFPGANGKIAFHSRRDGNPEIYVMNADGSGQTRLTTNAGWDSEPAWSPNGHRIAFSSSRDGTREIYVMNADGTNPTRLTTNPAYDFHPAWSPDGRQIIFISDRDGNREIYVMNADGSGQTRLTNHPASDLWPAWSPDGRLIAFTSSRNGTNSIYVMNADGSSQTRLTNEPAYDDDPTWSPDGRRIAFMSNRNGTSEIYVMNVDGSSQTRLTSHPGYDQYPAWSPDGRQITFMSDRDGTSEIYVMNADGSNATRLTTNPAGNALPDWQPRPVLSSGPVQPCPGAPVVDTFTRDQDGPLDGPPADGWWYNIEGIDGYAVVAGQVVVGGGGLIYWHQPYGTNQEASITLSKRGTTSSYQALLLKVQAPQYAGGPPRGMIMVNARLDNTIAVQTYQSSRNVWRTLAIFPAVISDGAQLMARARDNGAVEVYVNCTLVGMVDTALTDGSYFATRGGRVALSFDGLDARFDDFGAGTLD